jgi:hypothetical protein
MEIVIAVVVIGLVSYWIYTNFNKEKPDGSHGLDTFTKPTEVVPPAPVVEPAKIEAVAPLSGTTTSAVKKPRAPAKPRVKKAPKQ